jgi:hypothetical protein
VALFFLIIVLLFMVALIALFAFPPQRWSPKIPARRNSSCRRNRADGPTFSVLRGGVMSAIYRRLCPPIFRIPSVWRRIVAPNQPIRNDILK